MSLFGPPNVDKLRNRGDIGKLVRLLTHKDRHVASNALSALKQIAEDKEREQDRKQFWELYNYTNVIKKIQKLDSENKSAIEQLTKMLMTEEDALRKKAEKFQRDKNDIKKRFEESFKSLAMADDDFFNQLMKALGENKDFLYIMKLPGVYSMSSFSGVIVTKDEVIYFELNIGSEVYCFYYNEMKEVKLGKYKIKIISTKGYSMEFPISDEEKEMVAFIEEKYQKIIKN